MQARAVPLGDSPRTSRSSYALCLPVELPNGFESSSQGEFNLSFGTRKEEELSLAASEGWLETSEAEADAKMAAVLA